MDVCVGCFYEDICLFEDYVLCLISDEWCDGENE